MSPSAHSGRQIFIHHTTARSGFCFWHLGNQRKVDIHPFNLEMRHGKESDAEEARIVLYVLDDNFPVAQWMRSLKFIALDRSFPSPACGSGVKLQFQHAAVFGSADILALNNFQVVSNAGQQEDIGQTGIDTAVGGGVSGIVQRRFLGGVCREKAGVIAVFCNKRVE